MNGAILGDLGYLVGLAAWAVGVGSRFAGGGPDRIALALPLGLGILALATLGLGQLHALNPVGMFSVIGAGLPWAIWGWRDLIRSGRFEMRWDAFDLLAAGVLTVTFVSALAPVTDGDALCYHLQVPKVFLDRGSFGFDPDLHETVYPLVTESLYAVALAFRGPVACRLVSWLLGVGLLLSVTALARPALGSRARWAGAIALLVPAVSNGMSAPLNDVALASFGASAILAWTRWRDAPSVGAAALAGAMAGLALGVKYPALVLFGLLLLAAPRRPVQWLVFLATTLLVGGEWYLRAFLATGNPVFPFFREIFDGSGLDEVLDPIKRPLETTPWNLATSLGHLTLHPERFDSVAHEFGPVFLLFLPALAWVRPKPPARVWILAAIGLGFLTLCMTQRQSMRFLLIAVGPLAVAVAWLAAGWWERRSRPALALLAVLVLMLGYEAGVAALRARAALPVLLGRKSADDFLARREPTFVVGRWVDAHLPASAWLIGQDHRGFYIPRPYTMELAHRRRTGLGSRGESPDRIVETLRERGFTHLLMCPPIPEDAVEFDPTLSRLLAPWISAQTPLYAADLTDGDGVTRRYAIYELNCEADAP